LVIFLSRLNFTPDKPKNFNVGWLGEIFKITIGKLEKKFLIMVIIFSKGANYITIPCGTCSRRFWKLCKKNEFNSDSINAKIDLPSRKRAIIKN